MLAPLRFKNPSKICCIFNKTSENIRISCMDNYVEKVIHNIIPYDSKKIDILNNKHWILFNKNTEFCWMKCQRELSIQTHKPYEIIIDNRNKNIIYLEITKNTNLELSSGWKEQKPGIEIISQDTYNSYEHVVTHALRNYEQYHNMIPGTATYDDVNNSDGILAWSRCKRPLLSPSSLYQTSEYPGIDRNSSAIKKCQQQIFYAECYKNTV